MLRKLQYICLVGSIGLVGDRIDLFGGHGPFTLTLFLVLAPLTILLRFLNAPPAAMFHFRITKDVLRQIPFLVASGLFLLFALASVFLSWDPARSFVVFADLLLVVILGFCLSDAILQEPARAKLIGRSVTFGLIVYVIFCIGEAIAWNHGMFMQESKATSWTELTFAPQVSEFLVPRLSGATVDPNRAGFVLMMYLILLDQFGVRSRYTHVLRFVIAFLILLTMSRSAILCWCAYYVFSKTFWRRLLSRAALAGLAAIAILSSLAWVAYQREINDLAEAWEMSDAISARLSIGNVGSGQNHILLIQRGFDTWLTSTKTIITGIGLASAPKVLDDFFGDSKQGNFHCLYITVLAELGLPAFMVLLFLLGYPAIGRKGAVSSVAAFVVFNISYQSHMEPLFWVVLPLLWSFELRDRPKLRSLALQGVPAS